MELRFKAELWEWQGQGAWCFISVPKEYYEDIKLISSPLKKGFGSVRVEVTVGKSTWRTSIFPDAKSGTYLLPIKKALRTTENLTVGAIVQTTLRLIDF